MNTLIVKSGQVMWKRMMRLERSIAQSYRSLYFTYPCHHSSSYPPPQLISLANRRSLSQLKKSSLNLPVETSSMSASDDVDLNDASQAYNYLSQILRTRTIIKTPDVSIAIASLLKQRIVHVKLVFLMFPCLPYLPPSPELYHALAEATDHLVAQIHTIKSTDIYYSFKSLQDLPSESMDAATIAKILANFSILLKHCEIHPKFNGGKYIELFTSLRLLRGDTDAERKCIETVATKVSEFMDKDRTSFVLNERLINRMAWGIKRMNLESTEAKNLLHVYHNILKKHFPTTMMTMELASACCRLLQPMTGQQTQEKEIIRFLTKKLQSLPLSVSLTALNMIHLLTSLTSIDPTTTEGQQLITTVAAKIQASAAATRLSSEQLEIFFHRLTQISSPTSDSVNATFINTLATILSSPTRLSIHPLLLYHISFSTSRLHFVSSEEEKYLTPLAAFLANNRTSFKVNLTSADALFSLRKLCYHAFQNIVASKAYENYVSRIIDYLTAFQGIGLIFKKEENPLQAMLVAIPQLRYSSLSQDIEAAYITAICNIIEQDVNHATVPLEARDSVIISITEYMKDCQGLRPDEQRLIQLLITRYLQPVVQSNIAIHPNLVSRLIFSMRSLQGGSRAVNQYYDIIRNLIQPHIKSGIKLSSNNLASIFNGLQSMSRPSVSGRQLLESISKMIDLEKTNAQFSSGKAIATACFGMQNMHADSIGERMVISSLAKKIGLSTAAPIVEAVDIGRALYGLQNIRGKSTEERHLCRVVAHNLLRNEQSIEFRAGAILNACSGIRQLDTRVDSCRELLEAFHQLLRNGKVIGFTQANYDMIKEGFDEKIVKEHRDILDCLRPSITENPSLEDEEDDISDIKLLGERIFDQ
jgi:hypothetical protein